MVIPSTTFFPSNCWTIFCQILEGWNNFDKAFLAFNCSFLAAVSNLAITGASFFNVIDYGLEVGENMTFAWLHIWQRIAPRFASKRNHLHIVKHDFWTVRTLLLLIICLGIFYTSSGWNGSKEISTSYLKHRYIIKM